MGIRPHTLQIQAFCTTWKIPSKNCFDYQPITQLAGIQHSLSTTYQQQKCQIVSNKKNSLHSRNQAFVKF